MVIGQLENPNEGDEEVSAAQRHQRQRPGLESCDERKRANLVCWKCSGDGHPARFCPSADYCHDVDEVGTEQSSDADSELFGPDRG